MEPVIRVENLVKRHAGRGFGRRAPGFTAVDSVSFSILPGTTLALVGESGSGKSTLALCLACLERPTAGRIVFYGKEMTGFHEKQMRGVRPQIQMVFQDPGRSLNPRFSAIDAVSEPLLVQGRLDKQ